MPWPKEHKHNTRARIIEAAAAAFRQRGIADVSVGDVMREAGLTHGGFYAHFASKDDLLAAAVAFASSQVTEIVDSKAATDGPMPPLLRAAFAYLSTAHFSHPEWGCPIATLGADLIRSGPKVRRTFAAGIKERLEQLYELAPPGMPVETRKREVAGVLACMIGGLILARGLRESDGLEFLKDCQGFLKDALSSPTVAKSKNEAPVDSE
ncbi:MAG: TetR/AcrR family transcriptional regulator [Verrucomicrobia bacterium]|nr:TetR/AcrR family transcriptional regulator [Verrucomicrobiota bacterium]